jgi:hypothetical protein
MFRAATFSSKYLRRLLPGMGIISAPLCQQPGESKLAGRALFFLGNLFYTRDEIEVLLGNSHPETAEKCGDSHLERDGRIS